MCQDYFVCTKKGIKNLHVMLIYWDANRQGTAYLETKPTCELVFLFFPLCEYASTVKLFFFCFILLRQEHGYTQEKLAELSGVDCKHIQLLESNNPSSVKIDTIEKLAKAFGITPAKLLDF